MTVFANWHQGEHLRHDARLQFHHQTDDARFEAAGPQQLDVGIVIADLAGQAVEHAVELDTFDVDDQTLWIFDGEMGEFQRRVVFERDPGVIGGRPDAYRDDRRPAGGATGERRDREN
ncbi:hypothetical protein SDC9_115830 [bioreactor metagenome]|uniref:Uncharacterized protein n=1 Tax=bioreactor metagenome TaxID=1076179 RepID=A0A645BUG8_9ZZZZ